MLGFKRRRRESVRLSRLSGKQNWLANAAKLVETAVVTREAQDVCIVIRSRLLLLPTQLARKCEGKSQHEIRTILDAGIREALTALSDFELCRPQQVEGSEVIPIDELVEIWVRAHKEARDDDLSWWREACQYLRPPPEDDAILDDEAEKRSDSRAQDA